MHLTKRSLSADKCITGLRHIPIFVISLYRTLVSPLLPPVCRFYPTCSEYAMQAFKKYGCIRGGLLSLKRLLKCHPWHPGGYDPLE